MAFGSMNDGGNDAPMAEINVTPLVDVMLVLLIVFMVTMPVLTHSIPLNLPTAVDKKVELEQEPKAPMRISITADGKYFIGEAETSVEHLAQALKTQLAQDSETVLAIDADKAAEYDAVIKVLQAAQEVGLTKIGFVTEEPALLKAN